MRLLITLASVFSVITGVIGGDCDCEEIDNWVESFCDAEFALKANVTSDMISVGDGSSDVTYNLKIIKQLILPEGLDVDLSKVYVTQESLSCLEYEKMKYIITGYIDKDSTPNRLYVDPCSVNHGWDEFSADEKYWLLHDPQC